MLGRASGRRVQSRTRDQHPIEHQAPDRVHGRDIERHPGARVLAIEVGVFTLQRQPAPHFDFGAQGLCEVKRSGVPGAAPAAMRSDRSNTITLSPPTGASIAGAAPNQTPPA